MSDESKIIVDKKINPLLVPVREIYRQLSGRLFRSLRLMQLQKGGIRYLVWANEDVGKRFLLQRRYEEDELTAFDRLIRDGDICVDVGGNVGIFSLRFARACGPKGRVVVLEPIRRNFLVVQLAAEINGFRNIEVLPYALSNYSGFVRLEVPEQEGAYAYIGAQSSVGEVGAVRCMPLVDLLPEVGLAKIDVLKVDVEGAEALVLSGGAALFLNKEARPRVIMVELVDEFLHRFNSSVADVIKYLGEFGYHAKKVASGGRLEAFKEEDFNRYFNIFFTLD